MALWLFGGRAVSAAFGGSNLSCYYVVNERRFPSSPWSCHSRHFLKTRRLTRPDKGQDDPNVNGLYSYDTGITTVEMVVIYIKIATYDQHIPNFGRITTI